MLKDLWFRMSPSTSLKSTICVVPMTTMENCAQCVQQKSVSYVVSLLIWPSEYKKVRTPLSWQRGQVVAIVNTSSSSAIFHYPDRVY